MARVCVCVREREREREGGVKGICVGKDNNDEEDGNSKENSLKQSFNKNSALVPNGHNP